MHACIREGNGNPLQYSCLENPRYRGAWWAAIYGVARSRTRLKRLSSSSTQNRIYQNFLICKAHTRSKTKNRKWLSIVKSTFFYFNFSYSEWKIEVYFYSLCRKHYKIISYKCWWRAKDFENEEICRDESSSSLKLYFSALILVSF